MDNILKFKPFVRIFIAIVLVLTTVILLGAINIIIFREITFNEEILIALSLAIILIFIILCFIIKNEIKLINKHISKLNSSNESKDIIRNKFKFINDAEKTVKDNYNKSYALMHYDIKKFTVINNSVGYKVGDIILQQIAKTLQDNLKDEIIGKGEGDKFFVLQGYEKQNEVVDKALLISEKIEELDIWSEIKINPVIKTGIFFINKDDNPDIRAAIDMANIAKSILKNNYKSEYVIYYEEISSDLIEAKKIEDDMHRGLQKNEFKVYYQPKIDLKTGDIIGAEALVRWDHPELGLLFPDRFIPIFEKNGFIIELDKYVLEEVCSNMRNWNESGYKAIPISVNVSRVHFLRRDFVRDYNEIKEKYEISNQLLEIEITESVAFSNENVQEVFSVMKEFKEFGFEISIDDFGSGYSCLGLLKEMHIDTLKLDKIFLDNIEEYNSQVIIANIVNMAKSLKLNVVSEGVETDMQVEFLRHIGCDMAQGFVFARPEPVNSFVRLLSRDK